jgi:hypothetical protein
LYGGLTIQGDLNVIGSVVNFTVVNQFINGSILPQISGLFDLGSPTTIWNNVYANNVFAGNVYNKSAIDSMFANLSDDDSMYALNSSLSNYYPITNPSGFLNSSVACTVNGSNCQKYNDTALIQAVNSSLSNYLPIAGGTMNGAINYSFNGTVNTYANGCSQIVNATGLYWVC